MDADQSKEELLYQQVNYGNIEGIKALHRDGAGLEWIDKEGKTPLILACTRPDLLNVAKVLIELGANVNAHRSKMKHKKRRINRPRKRYHGGTPLHHAAKRGLEQTVYLLLSNGANPLAMNDDCLTPLEVARVKGHCNVVRAIESRICLFCGWLRELYGPSILEAFAPQWVQRKIWAVVLPCDSCNPNAPSKFELAIYPDLQVAQPRAIVALWNAHIEAPNFNLPDPPLIIIDQASKTRYKLLSANEGDKQQFMQFYNACRGISQQNSYVSVAPAGATAVPNPLQLNTSASTTSFPPAVPSHSSVPEDAQLALVAYGVPIPNTQPPDLMTDTNAWALSTENTSYNGSELEAPVILPSVHEAPPSLSFPSAPLLVEERGPIRYPTIDPSPVDLEMPAVGVSRPAEKPPADANGDGCSSSSGSCVICLDAPVEGACIPCGHMAGCMSCLNEIKGKRWGCPVCRAHIDQVTRLYAV